MEKHTGPRFARRSVGVVACGRHLAGLGAGWNPRLQLAGQTANGVPLDGGTKAEVGHTGPEIAPPPKPKGVGNDPQKTSLPSLATLSALPLTVAALAGCGGGGNKAAGTTPVALEDRRNGAHLATVGVANAGLGNDPRQLTRPHLCPFQRRTPGTPPAACSGACAVNWPPLRASGKPTPGSGADRSLVGTTDALRTEVSPGVTYNRPPALCLPAATRRPATSNGEGTHAFGGLWVRRLPGGKPGAFRPRL